MDTTMGKCKHCLTKVNNVYICSLVIWVEPSYHPTKHGEGGLKAPDEAEVKQNIREVQRKRRLEKRREKVAVKDSGRAAKPESKRVKMWPLQMFLRGYRESIAWKDMLQVRQSVQYCGYFAFITDFGKYVKERLQIEYYEPWAYKFDLYTNTTCGQTHYKPGSIMPASVRVTRYIERLDCGKMHNGNGKNKLCLFKSNVSVYPLPDALDTLQTGNSNSVTFRGSFKEE
ncbi:hypothetical protein CDAR_446461 [Caerostris darwini]|uniref:Uncharacterized protein n=1 Tax=Caerostris darwini TaxID=1538125 RepID=A0AAV4T0G9_9ARAC|nr:hypothetical protein CDAR_446461 [Caerostris darwini]